MKMTLILLIATSMIFPLTETQYTFKSLHEEKIAMDTADEHLIESMPNNNSVNACEDFYYYSCGKWLKKKIPDEKEDVSILSELEEELDNKLLHLMLEHLNGTEAVHLKLMKQTFWSCLDYYNIAKAGFKPVVEKLNYLLRSMLEFKEEEYDWIDTISKIRKLGYDHNFPLLINVFFNRIEIGSPVIKFKEMLSMTFVLKGFDIMKSTRALATIEFMQKYTSRPSEIEQWARNITYFEAVLSLFTWSTLLSPTMEIKMRTCIFDSLTPPHGKRLTVYQIYNNIRTCAVRITKRLQRGYWFGGSTPIVKPYVPHPMVELLKKIHSDEYYLEYEKNFTKFYKMNESNTNENTIEESQEISPEKSRRFKRHFRTKVPNRIEYTIKELQEIAPEINWLNYIRALFNDPIYENETLLITEINPIRYVAKFMKIVPKSDIGTYILWHVRMDYAARLKEMTRLSKEGRLRKCFGHIKKHMDIALSSYYVKRYIEKEDKEKATEIANYMKNAFVNILDSQDWMDKPSIENLKKKAMAIKVLVGYPDELLNDDIITNSYKNFNTKGYYADVYMEMKKLDVDKKFSKIREKKNKEWKEFSRATDVRTHYDSSQNTIYIPAAILQRPYFHKERPWFINFGILGGVIGREIAYRFIQEGSHLDKKKEPKWGTLVDQKYKENVRCITDQFREFAEENDLEILTITDQDAADSLGIQITYKAYTNWVKDHGKEGKHPWLVQTPNQLVWINAVRGLCGKNEQKSVREQKKRYHNSYKFRVINSVANQPEFENDFKCAVGTNPQNKCQFL